MHLLCLEYFSKPYLHIKNADADSYLPSYLFHDKNMSLKNCQKLRTNQEQAEAELLYNAILNNVLSQKRGFLAIWGCFSVYIKSCWQMRPKHLSRAIKLAIALLTLY